MQCIFYTSLYGAKDNILQERTKMFAITYVNAEWGEKSVSSGIYQTTHTYPYNFETLKQIAFKKEKQLFFWSAF